MKKIIRRQAITVMDNTQADLHPVIRKIFANRGITAFDSNLHGLYSYKQLLNIDKACQLLYRHLQQQHHIMIIGDFDADGATSTTVAILALKAFGAKNISYLVPNRFEYGYGLTPEIVAVAMQSKPHLLITVDNGISSIQGVQAAKQYSLDVLITDHHLPGETLPAADAIVNPNLKQDQFPSKSIAGVGVIFYVMLALRSFLREQGWFREQQIAEPVMAELLDLVALGTVADVVNLDQNNRILVSQGIKRIRAGYCRPGIKALMQIAQRRMERITTEDLAFAIAPRLNAAGRLEDMHIGIECLLSEDFTTAKNFAIKLNELNDERRLLQGQMQQQAWQSFQNFKPHDIPLGFCLYDKDWHQGIIGILAGKIKDQFHRPAIVFAKVNDQELKGSARSIAGLHIRDCFDLIAKRYPDLLQKFGGHAMAAGLSIQLKDLERFRQAFQLVLQEMLHEDALKQQIYSDGELNAQEISLDLAYLLRDAAPWGQAFPYPTFDGIFKIVQSEILQEKHLKLFLQHPADQKKIFNAICFNGVNQFNNMLNQEKLRVVYRLDVNEYQGFENLQLILEHMEMVEE